MSTMLILTRTAIMTCPQCPARRLGRTDFQTCCCCARPAREPAGSSTRTDRLSDRLLPGPSTRTDGLAVLRLFSAAPRGPLRPGGDWATGGSTWPPTTRPTSHPTPTPTSPRHTHPVAHRQLHPQPPMGVPSPALSGRSPTSLLRP
jgi:hypothetical protein